MCAADARSGSLRDPILRAPGAAAVVAGAGCRPGGWSPDPPVGYMNRGNQELSGQCPAEPGSGNPSPRDGRRCGGNDASVLPGHSGCRAGSISPTSMPSRSPRCSSQLSTQALTGRGKSPSGVAEKTIRSACAAFSAASLAAAACSSRANDHQLTSNSYLRPEPPDHWSQKAIARSRAAASSYTTTTDHAAFVSSRAPLSFVRVMVAVGKSCLCRQPLTPANALSQPFQSCSPGARKARKIRQT